MADYTINKIAYDGNTYNLKDDTSGYVKGATLNGSSIVNSSGIAEITDSNGNMSIDGTLSIATNNIEAINQKNSAGTYRKLVAYSGSNNLAIGSSNQTSDYASASSGTGGHTLLYGYNVIFYTGTGGSTTRSGYIDQSGNWNCADGDLRVKLATTEALYTAINTAGWTSSVIV